LSVFVASNSNLTSQEKTVSEETSSSWTISPNYKSVALTGNYQLGAKYTADLKRGTSSKWSVTVNDNVAGGMVRPY
jgi:hypothetical protein